MSSLMLSLARVPSNCLGKESPRNDEVLCFQDMDVVECLSHLPASANEVFLEHPVFDDDGRLPFQFDTLQTYQEKSPELLAMPEVFPDRFAMRQYGQSQLVCFIQNGSDKIVLTKEMLSKVVKYYHEAIAHAESSGRSSKYIRKHFYHKDIDNECEKHVDACETCILNKRGGRVYGKAGPRDASVLPWQEVHCDSIGSWDIELRARKLTFHALTMIDLCTNLVEIKGTLSTTAKENADALINIWFARYPRPIRVVSDQGPEFSSEFTDAIEELGIEHSTSSSRNPQGNSIIERIHQTIAQVIRTVCVARNPKSLHEGKACMEEELATAMHACRCTFSESLAFNTPGELAFGRDMFMDIPVIADIVAINNHRQLLVDRRLLHANAKQIRHDYAVGDLVYKRQYLGFSDKLKPTCTGPHEILRVHTNGTVTIQLKPHVTERINIRRVRPKVHLRQSR